MSLGCLLACVLLGVGVSGCAQWQVRETSHFRLHYKKGAPAEEHIDALAVKVETFYKDASETYDFIPDRRIPYYFHNQFPPVGFRSQCWGYIWMGEIHVAYADKGKDDSPHELRHYFLHKINRSAPDFFDEGSAGIGIIIQGRNLHQWVKQETPSEIDLESCIRNPDDIGETVDYVAYSFCTFLFDKLGKAKYQEFYRQVTKKNYAKVLDRLTGVPFGTLETEWKGLIQAQDTSRKKDEANIGQNR